MRIAYICADPGVPVFGVKGCSLHVQEVLREFVKRGDTIDLFAARIGGDAPSDLKSVRVCSVSPQPSDSAAGRELALQALNTALATRLAMEGPFDLIYERYALWAYAASEYGERVGTPSIVEVNAPLIQEQATHRELIDGRSAEITARRCLSAATLVACVSEEIAQYAQQLGADANQVMVVPNGVRTDRFTPRVSDRHDNDRFTIGFVGSLRPWHAVEDLLAAFDLLKQSDIDDRCRLVVVGDGPQRQKLERQAARMSQQASASVEFIGPVRPDRVPFWLQQFDVAVAPYASGETCYFSPLKVFEYLAAGLPTVSAATGQLRGLIEDGGTGLLYRPGDAPDLAEKLARLRDDRRLATRIGAAARDEAVNRHGWDRRVEQMLEAALRPDLVGGGA